VSHDLHLAMRRGTTLDAERLAAVLARQRHWKRADAKAWRYEDPETGVYGTLESDADPPPLSADLVAADLLANLNYARPSFFGRQFLPLIVEIANALDLRVVDPQDHEIGGDAKPKVAVLEELLATWDAGNAKSFGVARPLAVDLPRMSRANTLAWWEYMRARAEYKARLGERAFVPDLRLVRRTGTDRVVRLVIWVEGNPALFPACDLVAVLRPDAKKQFEMRGVIDRATLLDRLAPLMAETEFEDLPPQSILPAEQADEAPSRAGSLPLEAFAGFDPVAKDGFIDPD
jgi:hypothetical protein